MVKEFLNFRDGATLADELPQLVVGLGRDALACCLATFPVPPPPAAFVVLDDVCVGPGVGALPPALLALGRGGHLLWGEGGGGRQWG